MYSTPSGLCFYHFAMLGYSCSVSSRFPLATHRKVLRFLVIYTHSILKLLQIRLVGWRSLCGLAYQNFPAFCPFLSSTESEQIAQFGLLPKLPQHHKLISLLLGLFVSSDLPCHHFQELHLCYFNYSYLV